ncbi:MAG: sulfotransferase [Bacteroidia bacterium]|nr:sulfotransferase [Bacteroidia bacterium]
MSYSNFKDPVGLLKRMLASGNRAAYFTILREGLGVALKPLDWLLQGAERRRIRRAKPSDLPLILILGGSRSGTTLFYQTLAQYLPVSYFNNLSAPFPRSPITAGKLFSRFLRRGKKTFQNYYGSVSGFSGPNDGFHIWNRWLGEDRNAVPAQIAPEQVRDMQQFFHAWHEAFGKPFLNKNNRNSLCVQLFYEAFPRIVFVEIRRDPVYVIQSLIQSREAVQGSKYIAWGLASTDSDPGTDPLSYVDDICRQVHAVEAELDEARSAVPDAQYIRVSYESFCQNPAGVVQELSRRIWGAELPAAQLSDLKPFENTNRKRLSDAEFERILLRVNELYGQTA